jgi:hypothetical protein
VRFLGLDIKVQPFAVEKMRWPDCDSGQRALQQLGLARLAYRRKFRWRMATEYHDRLDRGHSKILRGLLVRLAHRERHLEDAHQDDVRHGRRHLGGDRYAGSAAQAEPVSNTHPVRDAVDCQQAAHWQHLRLEGTRRHHRALCSRPTARFPARCQRRGDFLPVKGR